MNEAAEFRRLVVARAGGRCECCGKPAKVDAHHRQPRGMGGVHGETRTIAHRASNGIGACRSCHVWIDLHAPEARAFGWLVVHPYDPAAIPALLYTAQGHGWWNLRDDGDFEWLDVEPGYTVGTSDAKSP